MTNTLQQIVEQEHRFFFVNRADGKLGFVHPTEFDMELNDVSRAKIEAFRQFHGACWLGRVNLYKSDLDKRIMWEHAEGQLVYNFGASFMIPAYDSELEQMIRDRDESEYTTTAADGVLIDVIHGRIEELGGMFLFWV